MRILFILLFSFLIYVSSFSQIINSSFILQDDTVCVNQTFTIQNTTTGGSITSTYWNFCSQSSVLTQTRNLGASSALAWPTFCSIVEDNGNYYIFVTNNNPSSIARYAYGNNLNNVPVITNLGNFGNTLPSQMEGIRIEKEGSNWYGIAVGGQFASAIVRLNFGNSLANMPTLTNFGNIGSLAYPVRLELIESGGNRYAFTVNHDNSTITRFNFGNSLANTPTATNLGNIGGLSGPCDIAFTYFGGVWYGFVIGQGNNTITRLNFGASLLNTPTGTNLGNPGGITNGRSIFLEQTCSGLKGWIGNGGGNNMLSLAFPSGPTGALVTTNLGNFSGFNYVHSIDKFRVGDTIFTYVPNTQSNSLSRMKYTNCTTGPIPSSILFQPGPFTYNAPGIYTITLSHNELKYNRSTYCSTIAVLGNTLVASASPAAGCSATPFNTTLSVTGAGSFTWEPGSVVGNSVVVTPTATTVYSVTTSSTSNCGNSQTVNVTVIATPTLNVNATSFTICSGKNTTLSASGATTYTWLPGNMTAANVTVSPTATTVYTVTGLNGGLCSDTKTIQIDVDPSPTVIVTPMPAVICLNSSITLTASGAVNYTWTPAAGLSSTNSAVTQASPSVTTVYTIQGQTAGCSSMAVMAVTVLPLPTVTVAQPSQTLCTNNIATLSAGGAVTYTWNPGNLTGASVTVSPSSATIYTVIGANGTCTGSATSTVQVATSPTVTANTSSTQICSGNTVNLTSAGANTYTWMPGFIVGQSITTLPSSGIHVYTVSGTNSVGCTNSAAVTVTVYPTPTINISFSSPFACTGQSFTLTASGGTSYTWFPGPITGSVYIDAPTPPTAQYTLFGSNGNCTGAAAATILVAQTPVTFVSASQTMICSGETPTLLASGADSYSWVPATFLSSQTGSVVASTPSSGICYTVTGYNSLGGCPSTATICLNVQPSPTVNVITIPDVICTGGTVSLEGSGATSYTWLPSGSNNTNISVSPTTTTTYTLFGQTGACIDTMATLITVNPQPTLSALVISPTLCLGRSTDMFVSGASSFTWEPGSIFGFSTSVSPTVNTTYTVTGNSLNCFSSQTVNVLVVQNPTLTILTTPTVACLDPTQNATLTAAGANTFTWLPSSTASQSLAVSPSVALMYTVSGTNSDGCVSASTIALNVNPDLHSDISDTTICSGSTVNLLANGAISYSWMPGSFMQATVNTIPEANTIYTIIASNGPCAKTGTVFVEVITNPIHSVPEVFTPNGDGVNDRFEIVSDAQTKIDIKVFNRWGALVYSHSEYDNSWDGTAKGEMVLGHNKLPAGTYYYVIDLESCDKQIIRGYVVIQY